MSGESSWAAERTQLFAQLEALRVKVGTLGNENKELHDENKALASSLAEVLQEVRSEKNMPPTASSAGKRGLLHEDVEAEESGIQVSNSRGDGGLRWLPKNTPHSNKDASEWSEMLLNFAAGISDDEDNLFDDPVPESPTVPSGISSTTFETSSHGKSTLSSAKECLHRNNEISLRQRSTVSASARSFKKTQSTEHSKAEDIVVVSYEGDEDLAKESSPEPPKSNILRSSPREQPAGNKRNNDACEPHTQSQVDSTKEAGSPRKKYKLRSAAAHKDIPLSDGKSHPRKQYQRRFAVRPDDQREDEDISPRKKYKLRSANAQSNVQLRGRKSSASIQASGSITCRKQNARKLSGISGSEASKSREPSDKHQLRKPVVLLIGSTATNFKAESNAAPKRTTDTSVNVGEDTAYSDDQSPEPATVEGENIEEEAEKPDKESDESDLPQEADMEAREEGPVKARHKCSECSATFLDARQRRKHYTTHNRYLCGTCGQDFDTVQLKKNHEKEHRAEFLCHICKTTFFSCKSRLEDHMKTTHPDAPMLICEQENNVRHELSHTTDKPFPCDLCSSTFCSQEVLDVHKEEVHAGKPPCYCEICYKFFKNAYILDSHMRLHVLKQAGETRMGKPSEEVFPCWKCPATFNNKKEARKHSLTHRPGYCCSYCGKTFLIKCHFVDHERRHTGELPCTCELCEKRFRTETLLRAHKRTAHHTNPPCVCEVCGKSFKVRSAFNTHMRIHSQTDKPFACSFCDKTYRKKGALKAHLRNHTGERPFKCPHCDAAFAQQTTLEGHVAFLHNHKNDRRFPCNHCERRFVKRLDLTRHERIHTGEKPFECEFCGDRFAEKGNMKKHQKNRHQDQLT